MEPTEARRHAFAEEAQRHIKAAVVAADSAQNAVAHADIVVLATASTTPVVMHEWVAPGTHICAVGACRPTHREMDSSLVARARTFVDSRQGAYAEAGDIVLAIEDGSITPDHVAGELGELAAGLIAGRQDDRQLTLFKSLGMAVEDVAAAHLAFLLASARGLGTDLAT